MPKVTGLNLNLPISIYESVDEAVAKGLDYSKQDPRPTALQIDQVNVVKGGTEAGNSTVDIVLVDENGNKYVTMVTSALLKNIPAFGPDV